MKKMYMKSTNIKIELDNLKNIGNRSEKIINEVNNILRNSNTAINKFNFDLLKTENIYSIKEIKKICINYRLRFLDVKYFKGDIPFEAIKKIDDLKKSHYTDLKGFKIMAPSKLFKLKNTDDPLLFIPIGKDYYYMVHKWGEDLHPLRKILMWPSKSMFNIIITTLFVSLFLTVLTPKSLFSKTNDISTFFIIFLFNFKALASIVIFCAFFLGKNFNKYIWNSKYNKS